MNTLEITISLLAVTVVALLFGCNSKAALSEASAREHLKHGALVVDVRTVAEFQAGHLPTAVNIPLDAVKEELPRRVPDKSAVLLLHCRSGRRSGIAEKELRALGYTQAHNIGSFEQAREIVESQAR